MNYQDEYIEQYLAGELDATEQEAFRQALQEDSELAEYVAQHAALLAGVEGHGYAKLKENIKKVAVGLEETGFFLTDEDIEAYLAEEMPLDEQIKISRWAAMHPDLKKRIDTQHSLLQAIEQQGLEHLKTQIGDVAAELENAGFFENNATLPKTETLPTKQEKKAQRPAFRYWMVAAAAVLLLTLSARFLFWPISGQSNDYQAYFVPLDDHLSEAINAELSERGFGGSVEPLKALKKGMTFYKEKQFPQAIDILKGYLKENPMAENVPEVQLYLAISYLANREAKAALPLLLSLQAASPTAELKEDCDWYLALAYTQTNKKTAAKKLLETLLRSEKYGENADELLHELK